MSKYKVGDAVLPNQNKRPCMTKDPESGFLCSLPDAVDHPEHVAMGPTRVLAVWPNEAEAAELPEAVDRDVLEAMWDELDDESSANRLDMQAALKGIKGAGFAIVRPDSIPTSANEEAEGEEDERPNPVAYAPEDGQTLYSKALDRYADNLEKQIKQVQETSYFFENDRERQYAVVRGLKSKLAVLTDDNKAFEERTYAAEARISALTTELAEERAKVEALEEELFEQEADCHALQAQLDASPREMPAKDVPEGWVAWSEKDGGWHEVSEWTKHNHKSNMITKPVVEPEPADKLQTIINEHWAYNGVAEELRDDILAAFELTPKVEP